MMTRGSPLSEMAPFQSVESAKATKKHVSGTERRSAVDSAPLATWSSSGVVSHSSSRSVGFTTE